MLDNKSLCYIDVETVPIVDKFDDLPETFSELWIKTCEKNNWLKDFTPSEYEKLWDDKASFHPEFSKIICISVGYYENLKPLNTFVTKSFYSSIENILLVKFIEFINKCLAINSFIAHFGKGFDYPFIIKRLYINDLKIPATFDIMGKKPWEIKLHDTHELWKFCGNHSASLELLAAVFGVKSPKADFDGSQVKKMYYAGELEKIARYCSNDVRCLASIVQKIALSGKDKSQSINIDYV